MGLNNGELYIVATPIGNIKDMSLRAIDTLNNVDIIACEDTRETLKLLNEYNIKKKLISYHEHNKYEKAESIIKYLKEGQKVALVTDQGTPIISDPGYSISSAVIKAGYNVVSLPGATAFVPALTSSGLEPAPFLFYGFLNSKNSKQMHELMALKDIKNTIIFYESVHRLVSTLNNMLNIFGDRNICICREISKIHEEYIRGKISEIISFVCDLKGEFVLIVEGNKNCIDYGELDISDHVKLYLDEMSEMDAIKKVARERNVAKSVIYNYYHNRK